MCFKEVIITMKELPVWNFVYIQLGKRCSHIWGRLLFLFITFIQKVISSWHLDSTNSLRHVLFIHFRSDSGIQIHYRNCFFNVNLSSLLKHDHLFLLIALIYHCLIIVQQINETFICAILRKGELLNSYKYSYS